MTEKDKIKMFEGAGVNDKIIYTRNNDIEYQEKHNVKLDGTLIRDKNWNSKVCKVSDILAVKPKNYTLQSYITFGSDPELFLTKDNEVVPSATVIDKQLDGVAEDGFQVELHPNEHTCRQTSAYFLALSIRTLKKFADEKGYNLSFSLAHTISDKVWKNTPKDTKKFGCSPTETAYKDKRKRVTGMREKFRAGGGHIHIGSTLVKENQPKMVQLLDIVVGNTLVLIDRNPDNATRRKNYGRAGEYRPKEYGLEYRVPSNFWLRDYILWSLTAGLVRNAVTLRLNGLEDKLIALFDMNKIRKAINENNYSLAVENFLIYKQFLHDNDIYHYTGLSKNNVDKFYKWATELDPLGEMNDGSNEQIIKGWYDAINSIKIGFEEFIKSR